MTEDRTDDMRDTLMESYRPRQAQGVSCAICGEAGSSLAFNAVEYYQDGNKPLPEAFVPMSSRSLGSSLTVRGSFPVCTRCAWACSNCGLPVHTEKLVEYFIRLHADLGEAVSWGNGICEHIHASLLFHALFKRLFRLGRFGNNRLQKPTS